MPRHSISLRHILIFHSHLLLCFSRALFPPDVHAKYSMYFSPLPHTCHVLHQSRFPSFRHQNNVWWEVQIILLFIMTISPVSLYLLPLRSKYLPQHPILEHPQLIFLPLKSQMSLSLTHTHTQASKTRCKMIFICTWIALRLRGNMIKMYNLYLSLSLIF